MLVELALPYADVCARDLTLDLGAKPQPGLGVVTLEAMGCRAQLRLLGSSHQALVHGDDFELSELVACRPGSDSALPAHASERRAGQRYEFSAEVQLLTAEDYARAAHDLITRLADAPDGLVGVFPGPADAFTALCFLAPKEYPGLAWRTWHGYPQTGEIVATASRLGPR